MVVENRVLQNVVFPNKNMLILNNLLFQKGIPNPDSPKTQVNEEREEEYQQA